MAWVGQDSTIKEQIANGSPRAIGSSNGAAGVFLISKSGNMVTLGRVSEVAGGAGRAWAAA